MLLYNKTQSDCAVWLVMCECVYFSSRYITICVPLRSVAETDRQRLPTESRRLRPGRILHRLLCCLSD